MYAQQNTRTNTKYTDYARNFYEERNYNVNPFPDLTSIMNFESTPLFENNNYNLSISGIKFADNFTPQTSHALRLLLSKVTNNNNTLLLPRTKSDSVLFSSQSTNNNKNITNNSHFIVAPSNDKFKPSEEMSDRELSVRKSSLSVQLDEGDLILPYKALSSPKLPSFFSYEDETVKVPEFRNETANEISLRHELLHNIRTMSRDAFFGNFHLRRNIKENRRRNEEITNSLILPLSNTVSGSNRNGIELSPNNFSAVSSANNSGPENELLSLKRNFESGKEIIPITSTVQSHSQVQTKELNSTSALRPLNSSPSNEIPFNGNDIQADVQQIPVFNTKFSEHYRERRNDNVIEALKEPNEPSLLIGNSSTIALSKMPVSFSGDRKALESKYSNKSDLNQSANSPIKDNFIYLGETKYFSEKYPKVNTLKRLGIRPVQETKDTSSKTHSKNKTNESNNVENYRKKVNGQLEEKKVPEKIKDEQKFPIRKKQNFISQNKKNISSIIKQIKNKIDNNKEKENTSNQIKFKIPQRRLSYFTRKRNHLKKLGSKKYKSIAAKEPISEREIGETVGDKLSLASVSLYNSDADHEGITVSNKKLLSKNEQVASRNDNYSPSPSRMDFYGKKPVGHRGRRKLRPTVPICPGILLRQNMDQWQAKKIWFFKNGDDHFHRYEYIFRPGRDIRDMEGLCDVLSKRLPLPRGVRYIFALDGFPIFSVGELENGQSYVASSTKAFKALSYSSNIESVPATVDDLVCRPPRPPSAGELRAPPAPGRMARERSFNALPPRRSPLGWGGGTQTHDMPKTFAPPQHQNGPPAPHGVGWSAGGNSSTWGQPPQGWAPPVPPVQQPVVQQQQQYVPASYQPPKLYQPPNGKPYAPPKQAPPPQHEYPLLQQGQASHGQHPQPHRKKKESRSKERERDSHDKPFLPPIHAQSMDRDEGETSASASTTKPSKSANPNGDFSNLPDNLPTAIPLEDNPRYTKSHDIAKSRPHSVCRPLPRQVIRIINGNNTTIQCQVLLNTKTAQEWEELIKDLAMAVKIPRGIASWMETLQGRPVVGYSGLGKELEAGNQGFYLYGDKHDMDKLMATQEGQAPGPSGPVPAIKIIAHGRRGSIAAMGAEQTNNAKSRGNTPEPDSQYPNENDGGDGRASPIPDGRKSSFSPDPLTMGRKSASFLVPDYQNQPDHFGSQNNFDHRQEYEHHGYESRHSSSHHPSPLKSALKTSSSYNINLNPDQEEIDGKKKEKKKKKKRKSMSERRRSSAGNVKAISFVSLSPSPLNDPPERQVE